MRWIGSLLLVVAFAAGVVSLYRSSIFAITTVDVVGNRQLTAEQVREIADMPAGSTLLRFPGEAMKVNLEGDPWIASATVSRDFPHSARIRIAERTPVALVDLGDASLWMVDRYGYMIAEQTAETTSSLIVIRDVEGLDPQAGAKTTSEALLNAIKVYEGLSDELRERTRVISASSIDKTALITTDDIEVLIGSADDIGKKDLIVRQILKEQAGTVVYVNVRTVDSPTSRGLDGQ